jgi:outer membrane lipoprotein-sorting protein
MSTELEQQLRDDMDSFTRRLTLPAGLAANAYRNGRKRQRTVRMLIAAAATTALAGGVAAAVASGGPGTAEQSRIDTAAYVIPHVRHALSVAEWNNTVVYYRTTSGTSMTWRPVPGGAIGSGIVGDGTEPGADSYETMVKYQDRFVFSAFGQDGQRVFSELSVLGKGSWTTTAVLYSSATWWNAATPTSPPPKKTTKCVTDRDSRTSDGPSGDLPDFIKDQLTCGVFKVAGTEVVDGVNAIKITGSATSAFPAASQTQYSGPTYWVDPETYLPVRMTLTRNGTLATQYDYQWLSPTPANRALLDLPVPAGFKQVKPPA